MILKYSERLYEDLNRELTNLKLDEKPVFKRLELSILTCIRTLTKLKTFFKENGPWTKAEEIEFFKKVKPKFKSLLIFHQQVLNIESRRPVGDTQAVSDYYLNELKVLTHYFDSHMSFYQYVRTEATHFDEQYFVRDVYHIHLNPYEGIVDFDTSFNTSHDSQVAHILANEMILAYLEKQILGANNKENSDLKTFMEEELVTWTQANTALVENIYGWYETKALNHGKLSLTRISRYMEKVFHVKLDDFFDTWGYISDRANKTIYMDEMKVGILNRISQKLGIRK